MKQIKDSEIFLEVIEKSRELKKISARKLSKLLYEKKECAESIEGKLYNLNEKYFYEITNHLFCFNLKYLESLSEILEVDMITLFFTYLKKHKLHKKYLCSIQDGYTIILQDFRRLGIRENIL